MELCIAFMEFDLYLTNPEEMIRIGLLRELEEMASYDGFTTEFNRSWINEDYNGIHFAFHKGITTGTYCYGDPHAPFTEEMLDDFISRVKEKLSGLTYEIRKEFYDDREEYETNRQIF